MEPIELRVLLTTEDGWWVARGVEHDVAACAQSIEDLQYEFERVLMTHVFLDLDHGVAPLSTVPPAPPDVQERWARGMAASMKRPHLSVGSRPAPELRTDARVF